MFIVFSWLIIYTYFDYLSIFSTLYLIYLTNNYDFIFLSLGYIILIILSVAFFKYELIDIHNYIYLITDLNCSINKYFKFKWYFLFFMLIKILLFFTIILTDYIDSKYKILYFTIIYYLLNIFYAFIEYLVNKKDHELMLNYFLSNVGIIIINFIPLILYVNYVDYNNKIGLKWLQFIFILTHLVLIIIFCILYGIIILIYNIFIRDCVDYFNNNSNLNRVNNNSNLNRVNNNSNLNRVNNNLNTLNEVKNYNTIIDIKNDYNIKIIENYNFKEISGQRKCLMCRKIQKCSLIEKKDNSTYDYNIICTTCDKNKSNIIFNECRHCNVCSNCIIFYELE